MSDNENKFRRFVVLLSKSQGVEATPEHVKGHIAFLRRLNAIGKLEMAGPFSDFPAGMLILKCGSREEAEALAKEDPFVLSGVRTMEVRTWELSCEENNHLGRG